MRYVLLLLALALSSVSAAHEVQHRLATSTAVSVCFTYADGKPFACETYELYPQGSEVPAQVGKTDAEGRVVFIPGARTGWRLRVFSNDGHGADFSFESPVLAVIESAAEPVDRTARVFFGLAAMLATFAAYQFFVRRKDRP